MSFSCTNAALRTLQAVKDVLGAELEPDNEVRLGLRLGFFERGDEQDDGAIVGKVFDLQGILVGRFRINADGSIAKFPGTTRLTRERIAQRAADPRFRSNRNVI